MKILKKLLIIGLFSFLFIIKVNASVDTNFTYANLQIFENYVNSYNGNVQDLVDLINDNLVLPDDIDNYENYIVFLSNMYDNHAVRVYVIRADNLNIGTFSGNNPRYTLILNTSNSNTSFGSYTDLTFNNNYTSFTQSSYNNRSLWLPLMDTSYYSNLGFYIIQTNMENLKYEQPSYATFSFSIDSQGEYNIDSEIPVTAFRGNYIYDIDMPTIIVDDNICGYTSQIGAVTNVKSISIRVRGTSNVLDFPNKGSIKLRSTDFINTNIDFKTFIHVSVESGPTSDDPLTDFNLSYNVSSLSTTYETEYNFDYSIQYIDDINTNFDIIFTFTSNDSTISNFFKNEILIFVGPYKCDLSTVSYGYTNDSSGVTISNDTALSNWLTDSNLPDLNSFIDTSLIPAGPVDSILTLPLNLMNSLLNKLNTSTCSAIVLPVPFAGGNITLPCVNTLYSQINGLNVFLNWFSTLFSAFILYKYFINLYRWVDDTLTFRENNHFGGF